VQLFSVITAYRCFLQTFIIYLLDATFTQTLSFCRRRSRFDDPEDRNSTTMEDVSHGSPPSSNQQDLMKDDRPVFERLKSLAEGMVPWDFNTQLIFLLVGITSKFASLSF
jgi:hypothetical protein